MARLSTRPCAAVPRSAAITAATTSATNTRLQMPSPARPEIADAPGLEPAGDANRPLPAAGTVDDARPEHDVLRRPASQLRLTVDLGASVGVLRQQGRGFATTPDAGP